MTTLTRSPRSFAWRGTPPQSQPERMQYAADLAAVMADPTVRFEAARRVLLAATAGLSGEELHSFGLLVVQQLKTPRALGGAA